MISIHASGGPFCLPMLVSRPVSRRATSLSGEVLAPSNARYAFAGMILISTSVCRSRSFGAILYPQMFDSVHFLRQSPGLPGMQPARLMS